MILPGSYANGFAPRDGQPLYPELWRGCVVAWAPSLGPTGLTLRDWSGYGNHGTLTNMFPGDDWVASQGRYALDFDGVGDRVSVTSSAAFAHGTGDFAYAIWMYPRQIGSNNRLFSFGDDQLNIDLGIFGAGSISYYNGSVSTASATGVVAANQWQHMTMMRRSGVVRVFINASEVITHANVVSVSGSRTFHLGGFPSQNFNGLLDTTMIFARSLTSNERRLLASRRGIAYELAPRRRSVLVTAAFNRRRRLLIGAG
jgi:hypothetical protein